MKKCMNKKNIFFVGFFSKSICEQICGKLHLKATNTKNDVIIIDPYYVVKPTFGCLFVSITSMSVVKLSGNTLFPI